jgi:hypothetical protein
VEELSKRWPNGYLELTLEVGLDTFLRAQDELIKASSSGVSDWKARIDAARAATKST